MCRKFIILTLLVIISLAHGQTTTPDDATTPEGTIVEFVASAPDDVKMNSYVEIINDATQFCIKAVQEVYGYAMGYECCYDNDNVKHEDGDKWTNSNGDSCECHTGNIQCIHDTLTTPAPTPTT
ncbi:unnamed protein product [Meganyctiphanes norvegica]|uniref:CBM10 domain-containing protein n=1 Tax=Meganyctiphanes norvegica TaxID=48144 RepID=A0AAV2PLD3_MEGNR